MEPASAPSGSGGAWYTKLFGSSSPSTPPPSAPPAVEAPPAAPSPPPAAPSTPPPSNTVTIEGANGTQHHIVVSVADNRSLGGELLSAALGVGGVVLAMYIVHRFIYGSGDKSDFAYERFDKTDTEGDEPAPLLSINDQLHAFEQFWAGPLPDSLLEILHWWNSPTLLDSFQGEMPKGLLLVGPPGTGKTHFARTLARVSSSAFFEANAAQFDEVYVGVGAQRVRRLFDQAEESTYPSRAKRWFSSDTPKRSRAIIFIDELDAIGTRTVYDNQANPSHQTVAQLLTCIDGLRSDTNVFVVAATNNIHALDPALTRSGRFDRIVQFKLPNNESRYRLLLHYVRLKKVECEEGLLMNMAQRTKGWNAADLKLLIDETVAIAKMKLFKLIRSQNSHAFDVNEAVLVIDQSMLWTAYERVQGKLNIHEGGPKNSARDQLKEMLKQRMAQMGVPPEAFANFEEADEDEPDD